MRQAAVPREMLPLGLQAHILLRSGAAAARARPVTRRSRTGCV